MDASLERQRRLVPTNDYVFKRLFSYRPALLIDLINAICGDRLRVTSLNVTNPHILPEEINGKEIVLDILAVDQYGRAFNIEMQVRNHRDWPARMLYYAASALTGQLKVGQDYGKLKPVIGIHLLDFDLFNDTTLAHWHFDLRDPRRPEQRLTDALQLELIELPKADRLMREAGSMANASGEQSDALSAWITFFRHAQEDNIMSDIRHEPVQQALHDLDSLSVFTQEWANALSRNKAAWDRAAMMDDAREEGLTQGRAAGLAEGLSAGKSELLLRQLTLKFGVLPQDALDSLHAATTDQLEAWAERVLFADSLEKVLQG